jgi:hypothetical protein
MAKLEWEEVKQNIYGTAQRAKVPGEWLVLIFPGGGEASLTFVPDPNHEWN